MLFCLCRYNQYFCLMIKGGILGLLLTFSMGSFAQKVGLQFYQGMNMPLVYFSGSQGTLDYQCQYNSDTRIGLFFGDLRKLSVSALVGASTVQASAMNDNISTSFTHSNVKLDIPIRYALPPSERKGTPSEFFIQSIAIVPSYGFLTGATQSVNGMYSRSEELFTKTNFFLGGEINFAAYSADHLAIHPYVSYAYMLSNADLDDDELKINQLSLGLRIDIYK